MNVNRSDASIIRKLMGFCKGNDKEKSDVLLDKEFYGNLGNKLYLRKVINWQVRFFGIFFRILLQCFIGIFLRSRWA